MNGDIIPPRRSQSPLDEAKAPEPADPLATPTPQPLDGLTPSTETSTPSTPPEEERPKRSRRRVLLWSLFGFVLLVLVAAGAGAAWYLQALQPVNAEDTSQVRISVKSGTGPRQIGKELYDKKLIRDAAAFDIYTRLSGTRDRLRAGAYSLSPSESTQDIVGHLTAGKADTINITFYPGATLRDTTKTDESKKVDVTTILLRAGYAKEEIDAALAKQYAHPLFEGKPTEADLEGYVYGETYTFSSDATAEEVLVHTFDVFYQKIQEQNVIELLKQRGLTLYQGITLASIIEREASSSDTTKASNDQRQVAQVFYLRLEQGMPLGSDPTAYYGADKIGSPRAVTVDTPYNTYIHAGLPPGPIAAPSIGALAAAAKPAPGDYVYFVSGDDNVTYFGRTEAEHQANIRNYCNIKCAMP